MRKEKTIEQDLYQAEQRLLSIAETETDRKIMKRWIEDLERLTAEYTKAVNK